MVSSVKHMSPLQSLYINNCINMIYMKWEINNLLFGNFYCHGPNIYLIVGPNKLAKYLFVYDLK